jgi:two-component system sensor histidine kinase ChvG
MPSRRCTAWAIALPKSDERLLALGWSARWSLTSRILAVNIFALGLLAGGFFYLDSYRARIVDERLQHYEAQAALAADALSDAPGAAQGALAARMGRTMASRVRVYAPDGRLILDSWAYGRPTYALPDPATEPWQRKAARFLDRVTDRVAGADRPAPYQEPAVDAATAWPEVGASTRSHTISSKLRRARDRTFMISAAAPLARRSGGTLLLTTNARDITKTVRAERLRLGIVLGIVTGVSVLLSLFLARTIVRPLRLLARAAQRVRLGRAREVQVPRLPARRDEIGLLARALSDMTQALRQRIDATEAFAADVAHELKNPLASLRSAVDTLERVTDESLRAQLLTLIHDDVRRLDRLITDIADASRVDAELSRARFEPIDLGAMIEGLVNGWRARPHRGDVQLAFARPHFGTAVVMGDPSRLVRVLENLVDNAVSFSPPGGLVQISAMRGHDEVLVRVDDEGPGVPVEARQAIFKRFHSIRPEGEAFGQHSGLGLAIAKATVEGHNGTIDVTDRDDGAPGARFVIHLPASAQ